MTCIAGIEHDGKVWIGGDSAGTAGWSQAVRSDEKVFTKEPMIFGFTSSFRMGQLLRYRLSIPGHPDGVDDHEYLCGVWVDSLRHCLKSGGFATVSEGVETGGHFLIGYRGRLYHVEADFQVGRTADGYAAVGCGADLALGALAVTDGEPKQRIREALAAAERHSAGVRGPFTVASL